MNTSHRLTNQAAFDGALLSLLNQGHSCVSASGHARYRGPRGRSAIGALIPDEIYLPSMEGKKIHHWLAARGPEYDALRERLGGVTPALLNELEDLHDRIGACMPSLYRQLAVAGAQRIAQSFKLSMRLVQRCAAYQYLRGPRLPWPPRAPAIPATPPTLDLTPATGPVATPAPISAPIKTGPIAPGLTAAPTLAQGPSATAPTLAQGPSAALPTSARGLSAAPTPAQGPSAAMPTSARGLPAAPTLAQGPSAAAPTSARGLPAAPMLAQGPSAAAPTPAQGLTAAPTLAQGPSATPAQNLTAAPTPPPGGPTAIPTPAPALAATPAQQPLPLTPSSPSSQQEDLDLIARGIARAIAAARRADQPG